MLAIAALGVASVPAKPAIRDSFFQAVYPAAQGTPIDDLPSASRHPHCGVCHYDFNGGGARNPQWRALRQRLLERPVLNRPQCTAALGMARLALSAAPTP